MGYAVKPDGSWRAVNSEMVLAADETYSETMPVLPNAVLEKLARIEARLGAAYANAKAIPSWARWDEATADAWFAANLRTPFSEATTLAAMKTVIGTLITVVWALARMVFALRDHTWPGLPEE
jgi:hypothetical protein